MKRLIALALICLAACNNEPETPPPPPIPEAPAWGAPLIGQTLSAAFPNAGGACTGYVDGVLARYGDAGVLVQGWGWNQAESKIFSGVVATNAEGLIRGAGATGVSRQDVVDAGGDVTDPNSGFQVLTPDSTGVARVYGVDPEAQTACLLGETTLDAH